MEAYPDESFFTPEEDRPVIGMRFDGENYELRWNNTTLYQFSIGTDEYDYMLHAINNENGIVVFRQQLGEQLWEHLVDFNYPMVSRPLLDQATIDTVAKIQADRLSDFPPNDL